jgi:hypothetical protein
MGSSLGSGGNLGTNTRAWGTLCELSEQIGNLVREGRRKKKKKRKGEETLVAEENL